MFDSNPPELSIDPSKSVLLLCGDPNTGKTEYLLKRATSFASEPQTERVLFLSNTLRNSTRLAQSVQLTNPKSLQEKIWFGTFQSIASRLLRIYGPAISLSPSFTVMNTTDSIRCFYKIRAEQGFIQESKQFPDPRKLFEIYLRTITHQENLITTLSEHFPEWTPEQKRISVVFRKYTAYKQANHTVDGSDLPLYWKVLLDNPVGEAIKCLFQQILVDNYEDITNLQSEIIAKMSNQIGLTAAGDTSQSVFSFLGGNPSHLLRLQNSPDTQTIQLTNPISVNPQLSTCTTQIMSNAVSVASTIPRSTLSVTAFSSEADQSAAIIDHILQAKKDGVAFNQQVILFRSGHLADDIESKLIENHIPFLKNGSARLSETSHLTEVFALLRILENPSDERAWENILLAITPSNPDEAYQLIERLRIRKDDKGLNRFIHGVGQLGGETNILLSNLRSFFRKCTEQKLPFTKELDEAIDFHRENLLSSYKNPTARLSNLYRLKGHLNSDTQRNQFLTNLTLELPLRPGDRSNLSIDEDYISLNTIHASKGQQWKAAYLIHASDREMPSHLAKGKVERAEEKKLAFIATSRATERLVISYCQNTEDLAKTPQQQLSPFLQPGYGAYLEETLVEPKSTPPPIDLSDVGADKAINQLFDHLWSN